MSVPNPEFPGQFPYDPELESALHETDVLFALREKLTSHYADAGLRDADAEEIQQKLEDKGSSIKPGGRLLKKDFDPEIAPDTYQQAIWEPILNTHTHAVLERIVVRYPVGDPIHGAYIPVATNAIFIELHLRTQEKPRYLMTEAGVFPYEDARKTVHKQTRRQPDGTEEWYFSADKVYWPLNSIQATELESHFAQSQMIEQS